jgi:hypothetical protein
VVAGLIMAMAAMDTYWNWVKHARPRAAVWIGRAAMALLFGGVLF